MSHDERTITVIPPAELDETTAPALYAQLERCAGDEIIRVDASELKFCASAGLRVFVSSRARQRACGGDLILVNPQPLVLRVLQLTDLLDFVADDIEEKA